MITLYKILCKNKNIHFIDVSLWDSFKLVDDGPHKGKSLLKLFTDIDRGEKLLTVAGKIFSYEDIEILENNSVDLFCLGRAAILDHQFPNRLKAERSNFQPYSAPVTRSHLLREGLSETFIDYMSTWKNFVSDVT
jgi:2,4-dienoyl-CoA reductase-like NADH-dependent reductase (Old Yellow Enzyme family)